MIAPGSGASDRALNCPPWASMIERQIDNPMPMPPGLVVKNASNIRAACSGIDTRPGILDFQHHGVGSIRARCDHRGARKVLHGRHGLNRVDDQVDDDLLKLDPVSLDGRQIRGQV